MKRTLDDSSTSTFRRTLRGGVLIARLEAKLNYANSRDRHYDEIKNKITSTVQCFIGRKQQLEQFIPANVDVRNPSIVCKSSHAEVSLVYTVKLHHD